MRLSSNAATVGGLAFVAGLAAGDGLVRMLEHAHMIDRPNARSSHTVPTPRGGGLIVATGLVAGIGAARLTGQPLPAAVLGVGAAYGALGLAEDVVGVPRMARLASQLAIGWAAGSTTGTSGVRGRLARAGTASWMTAYVNAFNFMDGIDGISIGQVLVACGTWATIGRRRRSPELVGLAMVTGGATLGFAPFNLPRARCFLGDVGSYGLGGLASKATVVALRSGAPVEVALAPLLPSIVDTSVTLVRRAARGEAWYEPHRSHVYQRLVQNGWSHTRTSGFVTGVAAMVSLLGLVGWRGSAWSRLACDLLSAAVLGLYLLSPRLVGRACRESETPET